MKGSSVLSHDHDERKRTGKAGTEKGQVWKVSRQPSKPLHPFSSGSSQEYITTISCFPSLYVSLSLQGESNMKLDTIKERRE